MAVKKVVKKAVPADAKELEKLLETNDIDRYKRHLGVLVDTFYCAYHRKDFEMEEIVGYRQSVAQHEELIASLPVQDPKRQFLRQYVDIARDFGRKIADCNTNEAEAVDGAKQVFQAQLNKINNTKSSDATLYSNITGFKDGNVFRAVPTALGTLAGWLGYSSEKAAAYAGIACYVISEVVIQFGCWYGKRKAEEKGSQEEIKLRQDFNTNIQKLKDFWQSKRRKKYEAAEKILCPGNAEKDKTMAEILKGPDLGDGGVDHSALVSVDED